MDEGQIFKHLLFEPCVGLTGTAAHMIYIATQRHLLLPFHDTFNLKGYDAVGQRQQTVFTGRIQGKAGEGPALLPDSMPIS